MATKKKETEVDVADDSGQDVHLIQAAEGVPMIYSAMLNIQAEVGAIIKTKKRDAGVQYKFRGIDDVMNHMYPLLIKHGVFMTPHKVDKYEHSTWVKNGKNVFDCHIEVEFRYYAADGSFVQSTMAAESSDYSDKATQQAISYCYREDFCKTFCIPTVDMSDGDDKMPDRSDDKPVTKLSGAPKLSDRPSPASTSSVIENAKAEAGIEITPEGAWEKIKTELEQFGLDDSRRHTWQIKTLREAKMVVPDNMINLPIDGGRYLYKVAAASNKAGKLLTAVPPEPEVVVDSAP